MTDELTVSKSDYGVLADMVREEFQLLDEQGVEEISTDTLAENVNNRIDPERISKLLTRFGCYCTLKQIARGICRQKQVAAESEAAQQSLFTHLQPRYPAFRDGQDKYVLRECLTYEERKENESRLRATGHGFINHADELGSETDGLVSQGKLALPGSPSEPRRINGATA